MPDEVLGRADELAAIGSFFERARDGAAGLVLEGDAGIGKTTLWEAAVQSARSGGFLVLQSRLARSEQALTLVGVTDLFGALPASDLDALPAPQRHALEVALLREEPSGILPDQRALAVAVATLLHDLASRGGVLVAIDDAQWLDESSAGVLAYAMRRLGSAPVGLLLSVRPPSAASAPPAVEELAAAVPADRAARLRVGPLPLAVLHQLFHHRLGRSFPRLALVRIEQASGGNALYAIEIARALIRSGAVPAPGEPLPVPETLGSLMAARIRSLPAATRDALALAAVAAEPTIETLSRANAAAVDALAPAIDDGTVSIEGGAVRFEHPLLAAAALALAGDARLRRLHRLLADASASDAARARHLGEAAEGPEEAVAEALERAATSARARGATVDAAVLYRRSSRLTPPGSPAQALRRATLAAECLFVDLSEIVEADEILESAIRHVPPGPARAEALSLRSLVRYYHGRVSEAVDLGTQALAEAGGDPAVRAKVLARVAFPRMQRDLEGGMAFLDEAVALLEAHPEAAEPGVVANALLLRACGDFGLVRPIRFDEIERGLALIERTGRSWEREGAEGSAFGLARHMDDLDRAIEMTRELIRAKSGPGGDDPFNLVQLSGLLLYRGDWSEARRLAEAAMEGYDREGTDVHPAWRLRGVALVAAHQGRLDEAGRLASEGLALAEERGDVVLAIFHRQILGFVALSAGEWQTAHVQLSDAAALAEGIATRHPGRFKLDGDRVEAALAVGDLECAGSIVARLARATEIAPTPWVAAVGARCEGLLAAARGDLDGAAAALDRALLAHAALPMPFEVGRTLLAKGQVHRRRKEKRLADESLREASRIFDELGAAVWTERARAELGRIGLRPRAPDDLTDTERRVAELAAAGLNSRQIAERAFLAPKTVGNVLGRIYLKLGIHSRAELGALMAPRARGDAAADARVEPAPPWV